MSRAPVVLGAYELVERIAEGGMAEVWKARAKGAAGFEKTVVIKRVLPALTAKPGFADLLVREAKISARLSHPNIAQVFDFGEEGGAHYIAMEYVHGKDLGQAMAFRGKAEEGLSLALRIWIMTEVAKALDHAHTRRGDDGRPMQIVHRDVSPQNVLLSYEGAVKVADFGIARADEQGLGRGEDPKVLRGKYAYMSPEQARGEPLDKRSDVFATGVVLFELLSGQRLFRGKTSQETLALVRRTHVPPLGPAGIDASLHPIVLKCLAADREQRYASANELYKDLVAWLFKRGEAVGEPDLADAMARMFPPEEAVAPNKLRVDLMLRAFQDATAMSSGPAVLAEEAADRTAAFPASRRARIDERRVAYLLADAREHDERAFTEATESADGQLFRVIDDVRVAAFGHAAGVERPAVHAVRAALAFRGRVRSEPGGAPLPRIAVVDGVGRIAEGVVMEPDDALIARARAILEASTPGEARVPSDLVAEVETAFRVRPDGSTAEVEAFRGRGERVRESGRRLPLVGRREELRQLTEALVATTQGRPSIVRLVGEAGVGKSRLLGELRGLAAPTDFTFVAGQAEEAEVDEPYALLADLVRDIAGVERDDGPHDRFAKVERLRVLGISPREVRLCGELLGLNYPTPVRPRDGRPRGVELAVAIRKALVALSQDRALIVVLEDVQWCDDASRQLVPLIARGLGGTRTTLIVTSRPGTITPRFSPGTIVEGERAVQPHSLRALRVTPLGLEATARLVAVCLTQREAPTELAQAVQEETGGLPAWIPIALEQGTKDGKLVREGPPPPAVVRQVDAWLEALDPLERAVLTTAAAYGAAISVDLLVAIEGLVGDTGHGIVRRLLSRRLLAADARPGSRRPPPRVMDPVSDPALVYPLGPWGGYGERDLPRDVRVAAGYVQRAALAALDEGARARLHDRILGALERAAVAETVDADGGEAIRAAMLAQHASRGSDRRRAPDYLRAAADAAERVGQHTAAARHCLAAVRILREDELDPEHERLVPLSLRGLDLALAASDHGLAAELVAELETALADSGTAEDKACLLFAGARMLLDRDDPRGVLSRMKAAEVVLGAAREPWPSRLYLLAARAHVGAGELVPAAAALKRAAEGFGKIGDTLHEGRALALLADIEARLGALEEARRSTARVLALAARHGDAQIRADSLAAMGAEREASGDHEGALDRFREAIEVATAARLDTDLVALSLRAALAALRARQDAEAGSRAHTAIEAARKRKLEAAQLLGGAVQSAIAAFSYPDAAYSMAIERAVQKLEEMQRPLELAACLELLARTEQALDRPDAASAAAERAMIVAQQAGWRALGRILGG